MLPFYALLGLVALGGAGWLMSQVRRGKAATQPVAVNITPEALMRVEGISIGRADAPVQIYEFADFQCPACATFATLTEPGIRSRLVDPGIARYTYYDFPLPMHPNAFLAARAGRCANEQGKFWDYHGVLYGQQSNWAAEGDPSGLFEDYSEQVGLDRDRFEGCLQSDRYAREVSESAKLGESLGVGGTPTLIVNGKRIPTPGSAEELEQYIRREVLPQGASGPAAAAPAGTTAPAVR